MARKPASSSIRSLRSIPPSTPSSSKNRRRLLQVSPLRRSEEPEGGRLEDQCAGAGVFGIKLSGKTAQRASAKMLVPPPVRVLQVKCSITRRPDASDH